MTEFNQNVPMLGQKQQVRAIPPMFVSLVRTLDEHGTFEPESTQLGPTGQIQAVAGRSNLMSGEDLVEAVVDALMPQITARLRDIIKQELAALKG